MSEESAWAKVDELEDRLRRIAIILAQYKSGELWSSEAMRRIESDFATYEQGWRDGYGQGRDDEADALPMRSPA